MQKWDCFDFSKVNQIENDCTDIVEVEKGSEWKLRKLHESQPEFCWKYPEAYIITENQLNRFRNNPDAPVFFYGLVVHCASPLQISIQPKYLKKASEKIEFCLQEIADQSGFQDLESDQFLANAPCVCRIRDKWFRGKILRDLSTFAEVELIDERTSTVFPKEKIKKLPISFARIPPLALKCCLAGTSTSILSTKKILKFEKELTDCNNEVLVQLCSEVEPYQIKIFHPTEENKNLAVSFLPRQKDKQRKQPNKQYEHSDSEYDDEEEELETSEI